MRENARRNAHVARDTQIAVHDDGRIRFRSETSFHGAGWLFSVYDVAQCGGRTQKLALEATEATHRVFVMADGCRWVYAFTPGERRTLIPRVLEVQLDAAKYVNGDMTRANPR